MIDLQTGSKHRANQLGVFVVAMTVSFGAAATEVTAAGRVGFSKVDITPNQPLRLSGYAVRSESHRAVADSLSVRTMVLSPEENAEDAKSHVLVSVDSIAVTSAMTVEISNWLQEAYGIPRSQFALCSTHSHAAPHISGGLNNLYRTVSTPEQERATEQYTKRVLNAIQEGIQTAMASRALAQLSIGDGQAGFAVNRRVIRDGSWEGFGERDTGPVDHRVRVIRATTPGGKLLGAAFLYACHCTTLGGDFNDVSGDWAGLAASRLEQLHSGAVFLPIIGCGADANPLSRGSYDVAQKHAAEMVDSVQGVLARPSLTILDAFPVGHFGYAGLAAEQPTEERLETMRQSQQPNEARWAKHMLQVRKEMGRLPETVPMPIHIWQFGDQLTWVFLGGEVVVDYQFQIEKELPTEQTWVAAYTDDVFAYVASENMRSEGGYEVDFSMIYYLQPGRWQAGTQSLILRRVAEIFRESKAQEGPLEAEETLRSLRVPAGFRVELVASEPMVQDPVNLSFGPDGRVWVVEMADYPRGVAGGGRVKCLQDLDQDGRLDQAQLFLDGLSFPTSAVPWKDGVIVIAAPDVLFAADRNGDGKADVQETLLSGIGRANPQHRASGFELGLDGWLHFSAGESTREIHSARSNRTYDVHHRDIAWNPDSGEIVTTSGETQFVRARDAFGNWYGNSNSLPMYHYVIEDRYLRRSSVAGGVRQHLLTPAIAPPVKPRSRTVDRFNDLFAHNRFTSACSSIVCRVPGMATGSEQIGLVCEPVHNLVSRIRIDADGSSFSATRHEQDTEFDFLTSTDPWCRPVRVVNAPDGSIWVVDMSRQVIEHPQWIPTAWQKRLNLRSGSKLGRIYRVYREDFHPTALPRLSSQATSLLPSLASENGAVRDLAVQHILHDEGLRIEDDVRRIAREHPGSAVRASALGCLAAKSWLTRDDVRGALAASDPRLVRLAIELAERWETSGEELADALRSVVGRNLGAQVDLQWVLTSTVLSDFDASDGLSRIAARSRGDAWIARALSLVKDDQQAFAIVQQMLTMWPDNQEMPPQTFADVESCLLNLWKKSPDAERTELALQRLAAMASDSNQSFGHADLLILSVLARANSSTGDGEHAQMQASLRRVSGRTQSRMLQPSVAERERIALVNLIGRGLAAEEDELSGAERLLAGDGTAKLRRATIEALRRLKTTRVADVLLDAWPECTPPERAAVCATLLSRSSWVGKFVSLLESGQIKPADLDLATVHQLRSYRDRSLRSRCVAVFGKPTQRSAVVARYLAEIPQPQTTAGGKKLFQEHCAACHQAREDQSMLGPPLENLGHWTVDQWVTSILDPNRAVEPKYHQSTILTTDGRVLSGVVHQRAAQSVRLAASDGSIKDLETSEIESIRESNLSLMPEGFENKLSPEQLSELIGFLRGR